MKDLFNAQARRAAAYNKYYGIHAVVVQENLAKLRKNCEKKTHDNRCKIRKDLFCCTPLTYAVIKMFVIMKQL